MLSRSAGKPIFVGLSTAALVAAGGIPAWADDPSPKTSTSTSTAPSDPESPEAPEAPPIPRLSVDVNPGTSSTSPGTRVKVITLIAAEKANASDVKIESIVAKSSQAKVKPTVTGPCPSPFTGPRCKLGELTKGEDFAKSIVSYVTVPKMLAKTTSVTFTVTVSGKDIKTTASAAKFTYVVKPKPKPKPTPPKLTPDSGDGPSDGKSGKSGSGSGSSNNSGSNGSNSGGNSAPYVPPRPNGTFNPSGVQSPKVALPPIAQPSPSVAPAAAPPTPNSRLRGNERPVAQDLTFERMASTQVAWLAALMVAFSLLLTQLRLGRRRTGPAAAPIRPRGDHRRPRRGVFGK